jgi:hypothetical protein
MGGSGSSRWKKHRKARLVTEAMAIDLRDSEWKAVLTNDRAEGAVRWSRSGSPRAWIDFLLAPVNSDGNRRNLVLDSTGDEYEPKQLVVLGLRLAGFSRQWFAGCQGCDRWVKSLYALSQNDRFRCRVCCGLTYASVQAHDARSDLARRDPVGFAQSRARAPQTVNSQLVTATLNLEALDPYRPGRGWGRKSTTSLPTTPWTQLVDQMRQDYIDRWGFPPEDAGRIARSD